jgi:MFS family permease
MPRADVGPGSTGRLGVLRNIPFALVWFAGVISQIGDWALAIGLAFYVYVVTGSTLATGALLLAWILPQSVVGLFAGVFVDRWSRKRTMVYSNLVLAAGLIPLPLVHSTGLLWVIYAVVLFESAVSPFFCRAEGALIPSLVGEAGLLQANSVYGAGRQVARLIGAAAGGLLVGFFGLLGVTFVDAASFVVAAVLILPIVESRRTVAGAVLRGGGRVRSVFSRFKTEWIDGLAVALRSRRATAILVFGVITGIGEGVFGTLVAPFVVSVLHGNGPDYGYFSSVQAIGGVIGGVFVASRARHWNPVRVLPAASVVFGALDLVLFNYPLFIPGIGLAFVLLVLIGLPASAVGASFTSLQQSAVSDSHRGRYISLSQTTSLVAMTGGLLLAGFLGGPWGVIPLLEIQGLAYVVAGATVAAARLSRPEPDGTPLADPPTTVSTGSDS